jgi:hypothetical protein
MIGKLPTLAGLSPAALLATTPGHLYVAANIAVWIAFAVFARNRIRITLVLGCALFIFQLITGCIGWDRIAAAMVALAVTGVAVQFIRENAAIIQELHRTNVKFGKLLGKTASLWWPMLIIAVIGFVAHSYLVNILTQAVYATTPIDEYCTVKVPAASDEGSPSIEHVIPCRETGGIVRIADIKSRSFEEDATNQVARIYLAQQATFLDKQSTVPPSSYLEAKYLSGSQTELAKLLQPRILLALPNVNWTVEERIDRDPTVMQLRAQIAALQVTHAVGINLGQYFGGGRVISVPAGTPQQIALVRSNLDRRAAEIKASFAAQPVASAKDAAHELEQSLARATDGLAADLGKAVSLAKAEHDPERAKAMYLAEATRSIATLSDTASKVIASTIQGWRGIKQKADTEAAYRLLGVVHLCSLDRPSTRIFTDTTYKKPVTVNLPTFPCWNSSAESLVAMPLTLERSKDESIAFWKRQRFDKIEADVRRALLADMNKREDAIGGAVHLGTMVPEAIDLGREYCVWIPPTTWGHCVANYAKEKAEGAYYDARADLGRKYNASVHDNATVGATSAEFVILAARSQAHTMLENSAEQMRKSLDYTIEGLQIADYVLLTLVALAMLKSFLYVFAIVVYDLTAAATIKLPGNTGNVQGSFRISAPDRALTLDSKFKPKIITRAILNNQTLHVVPAPWPLSAVLGRLLHWKYFSYNKGGPYPNGKPIVLSTAKATYLVEWQMKAGEEVVFRYGNFFGASENIELQTTISLSLSTLLLERIIFHSAYCKKGEGRLFLTAPALNPKTLITDAIDDTLPLELLAWSRHSEFQVHSELTVRATLIDGYKLNRASAGSKGRGLAIIAQPEENVSIFRGTLRFARRLLSPI